jgi:hypothetical protein
VLNPQIVSAKARYDAAVIAATNALTAFNLAKAEYQNSQSNYMRVVIQNGGNTNAPASQAAFNAQNTAEAKATTALSVYNSSVKEFEAAKTAFAQYS